MPTIDIPDNNPRRGQVTASAAQDTFNYAYIVFAAGDLKVVVDGVELTEGTDYTVTGVGAEAGGTFVLTTPCVGGELVTHFGLTTIGRASQYQVDGRFDAPPLERDFDRLTVILQEQTRDIKRTAKLNVEDTSTALELPVASTGKALKWDAGGDLINSTFDPDAQVTLAQAAATTATTQAGISTTQAGISTTQAGISTTQAGLSDAARIASEAAQTASEVAQAASEAAQTASEVAQAASEAAQTAAEAAAANLIGTSTTSVEVGTGSKAFTTQAGKYFAAGNWLLITSDADPANYMHGQVTAYSTTSLTVNVTNIGGTGTLADWTIRVSGTRGAVGATGATGDTGATGPAGSVSDGDKGDITVSSGGETWTIDNDAVTTAKINDDAVTLAKMAAGTAGNLITYDASGAPAAVATGTAGQVLTSGGAGVAPAFVDAGGGGADVYVVAMSGSTTDVDLTQAYSRLEFILVDVTKSGSAATRVAISDDNKATFGTVHTLDIASTGRMCGRGIITHTGVAATNKRAMAGASIDGTTYASGSNGFNSSYVESVKTGVTTNLRFSTSANAHNGGEVVVIAYK